MDTTFSVFLLFLAAITALISYLTIPYIPVVMLMAGAAALLAGGVWWHWTQFSVDYRTSTWQEQLRNYASYVLVLVVILLVYAFYAFTRSGRSVQQVAIQTQEVLRNTGRRTTSTAARSLSSMSNTLFAAPVAAFNAIRNATPAAIIPEEGEAGILE
jgi:hypothetical protein